MVKDCRDVSRHFTLGFKPMASAGGRAYNVMGHGGEAKPPEADSFLVDVLLIGIGKLALVSCYEQIVILVCILPVSLCRWTTLANSRFWRGGEVVSLSMGFDLGGAVTLPRKMHFPSKLCILVNFHGALLVSSSGIGA